MSDNHIDFLKSLTEILGPSGREELVQKSFINYVTPFSDQITITNLGSVIAEKKGNSDLKIMLCGHADEITLIVNYVDDQGFIYFKAMGGFDATILPGMRVNIHHNDYIIYGIIGRKPKHLISGEHNQIKIDDLWIDIGSSGKEETLSKVELGDIISWHGSFLHLNNDLYASKAFDDRVGVYTVARVMESLKNHPIFANVYGVSSVQEEVGGRGAKTASNYVEPDISIVIDVTFATDHPDTSIKESAEIKLGAGPALTIGSRINTKLLNLVKKIATDNNIPYQLEIWPSNTGTDLDQIHHNDKGSAGLLISIPCRYMHSPNEIISFNDVENTVSLITKFILNIKDKEIISFL